MVGSINTAVVDASFVLAYFLPDERAAAMKVDEVIGSHGVGKIKLISITLLPYEVMNGLKAAVRQKRIDRETCSTIIENFVAMSINLIESDHQEIFRVALTYDLSVYDAAYASLAQQKNCPLYTFDKKLMNVMQVIQK